MPNDKTPRAAADPPRADLASALDQLDRDFRGPSLALMARRRLAAMLAQARKEGSTGIAAFDARIVRGRFEARADLAPGARMALVDRFALAPESGSFAGLALRHALLAAGPSRLVERFAARAFGRALAAERALAAAGALSPKPEPPDEPA